MASTIGELKGIKGGMEIEWKIPDFFSLPEKADVNYYSPEFHFADTSWYLNLYPAGQAKKDTVGQINCYLYWRTLTRSISLDVQIGLKNKDGKLDDDCSYTKTFDENHQSWGCTRIVARSQLLSRKSDLVPSDVLTFICRMTEYKPAIVPSPPLKRILKLSNDFGELLKNGNGSDLTVKVNEQEFKLHKIILGIRSPTFATEIKKKMEESSKNVVDISDCEEIIFQIFLVYIYTGLVDRALLQKNFLGLYEIAEKYDVAELKEECLNCIKNNLSIDMFFDAVILAEKYDEKDLKSLNSKFCSDNLKDLVKNPMWLTFMQENTEKAYQLLSMSLNYYVKSKN